MLSAIPSAGYNVYRPHHDIHLVRAASAVFTNDGIPSAGTDLALPGSAPCSDLHLVMGTIRVLKEQRVRWINKLEAFIRFGLEVQVDV